MSQRIARFALMICILAFGITMPSLALAHGGHTGPAQTFTQAVGPYELAITIEIPSAAPSPLYLDILPQSDINGATLSFRAVPRGQPFDGAPVAQLQGMPGPQGIYYTQLDVDRLGDWELEARADGPLGSGVARIPFTIEAPPLAGATAMLWYRDSQPTPTARRCRGCAYDLTGNVSGRCSECGMPWDEQEAAETKGPADRA